MKKYIDINVTKRINVEARIDTDIFVIVPTIICGNLGWGTKGILIAFLCFQVEIEW